MRAARCGRVAGEPVGAFAPGRANLIGEHTDYNEGLCLPFAIEAGVRVDAWPARAGLVAHALDLGEEVELRGPPRRGRGFAAFVAGTVAELEAAGVEPRPVRVEVRGDVPRGAGLGSSAALCVALTLALCAASGAEPPPPLELARLCSRVENEWVGTRTGLLDQLASLHGERGSAVRIDMRGPELAPVRLPLDGHRLVVLDSGAARELAASGYNARREECGAACSLLGVGSLRSASPGAADRLPEPLRRRALHVLAENRRVDEMVGALRTGDMRAAGSLLDASHASLRDLYEVSTPAVEATVERARAAGALGARIMGGGFGGSVLALFAPGGAPPADALAVAPGPGARLL